MRTRSWCFVVASLLAGCTSHGSSSGGGSSQGGGASAAPATSGTAPTSTSSSSSSSSSSSPAPSGPRDFSGIWEVSGADARGPYHGTAALVASGSLYNVQRLVTYQTKLPSGQDLLAAWNMTATPEPNGLHVQASLRRAHIASRVGALQRTAADRQPLAVDDVFAAPGPLGAVTKGTRLQGSVAAGSTEKWVFTGPGAAPDFPAKAETLVPLHSPASSTVKKTLFALFAGYHQLPAVAPYVARADFQAAIHSVPVDHTARDFYRRRGPTAVVVLDEVVDDISVFEETGRANAFSKLLHEKAAGFDADMEAKHLDATGMIANSSSGQLHVSGDGALHTGSWVASQAYRYLATGDPKALANVERGTAALVTLVDITPDKTQFARAVQDAATAPASWTRGSGAYASVAWLPGGNNDMLHGIEYGFLTAEQVLPQGHPLRAAIGAQARSLLENVSIAGSGTHEIFLASVAWRTTGDPAMQARYKSALTGNLKERVWTASGSGIWSVQGIGDWSGHHLGAVMFCGLRILGGATPDPDEQGWRTVGQTGILAAFVADGPAREGMVDSIAAAFGAPGAADAAKDVLAEIPYPKPIGDAVFSRDVSDDYSVSPYPSDPWKGDWMTNPCRVQALTGLPLFYWAGDENLWARGPLTTGSTVDAEEKTSQDYLHAYWLGRAAGFIAASD